MLAYHDRSDGGLLVTLLEMAFAGHCGLEVDLGTAGDPLAECFAEELGACLQVPAARAAAARAIVGASWLGESVSRHRQRRERRRDPGARQRSQRCTRRPGSTCTALGAKCPIACRRCATIRSARARSTRGCSMSTIRVCTRRSASTRARMSPRPTSQHGARPAVAVLREQGVNSQTEMAAVLHARGIRCLRCAHDRHSRAAHAARRASTAWSPAAASPTAMCSAPAKAGRNRSCSTPLARDEFSGLLRA